MNTYMTEQEQLQAIRVWLKKYLPSLIVGIVIALVGSFGWRYFLQHQLQQRQQASMLYEQMLVTQADHQIQQTTQIANNLMTQYKSTPYASLAGLLLASQYVDQGDLNSAYQNLQWVVKHGDSAIKEIAKIRTARILIAQKKAQDALNLLKEISDNAFLSEVAVVKGDAFAALGDKDSAKTAYQQALTSLPANATIKSIVEMKLSQL